MQFPELIETPRLLIRPPVVADARTIHETYGTDPEVVRYLTWRPHRSLADAEAFMREGLQRRAAGADLFWALTLKGDDRIIGMIAVHPGPYRAGLGYVLARPYWGRGLMTQAVRAFVELALAQPGVFRVWAVCDVDNLASARVLEKAGLTREGVLRRWSLHPNISDEPRDSLCYSKVK
ncbi:MAG TPA: GNAT family N-acetyltransferase [Pyrinomonadaceae bacterium]